MDFLTEENEDDSIRLGNDDWVRVSVRTKGEMDYKVGVLCGV